MTNIKSAQCVNNLELIPISKWNDYYPYPSVGALRQLLFYDKFGFSRVTRKISNRIYIKVSDFFNWVEESQQAKLKRGM